VDKRVTRALDAMVTEREQSQATRCDHESPRSEYREENGTEPVHSSADGVPVFRTFESFTPRTSALINGGILTLVVFCAAALALRYSWTHPVIITFRGIQFTTSSDVGPGASFPTTPAAHGARVHSEQPSISPHPGTKLGAAPSSLKRPPSWQLSTPAVLSEIRTEGRLDASGLKHRQTTAVAPFAQPFGPAVVGLETPMLLSYAGAYTTDPPNELTVLITLENGQLAIEIPGEPRSILVPTNRTTFVFSDVKNNWVEFVKHDNEIVSELNICRNGSHLTAHRVTK
jgi:hypothetical protein